MHRGVPWGTACSCAPSSAVRSRPSAVRAELAGNSAVRSGVDVKKMLTTSSCESSLRAKSSFTNRAVLASISALESSVHVIAPRSAWSLIGRSRLAWWVLGSGAVVVARSGRFVEAAHLPRRQRAPVTRLQTAVVQRADAGAHQAPHRVPDRVAHPTYLAVAPLVDADLHRSRAASSLHHLHARRRGGPVVELDALAQAPHGARRGIAVDFGQVGLHHAEARVREQLRELAVVGEEQEALGV